MMMMMMMMMMVTMIDEEEMDEDDHKIRPNFNTYWMSKLCGSRVHIVSYFFLLGVPPKMKIS